MSFFHMSSGTYAPEAAKPLVGRIEFAPEFTSKAGEQVKRDRQDPRRFQPAIGVKIGPPFTIPYPEPDPRHFTIDQVEWIGNGLIVGITYPGCTHYEGRKVLVFDRWSESALRQCRVIDPHFIDVAPEGIPMPVARFHPTTAGWRLARICAAAL